MDLLINAFFTGLKLALNAILYAGYAIALLIQNLFEIMPNAITAVAVILIAKATISKLLNH